MNPALARYRDKLADTLATGIESGEIDLPEAIAIASHVLRGLIRISPRSDRAEIVDYLSREIRGCASTPERTLMKAFH